MGRTASTYVLQIGESSVRVGSGTGSKIASAIRGWTKGVANGMQMPEWSTDPAAFGSFKDPYVKGHTIYIDPDSLTKSGYVRGTNGKVAIDARFLDAAHVKPKARTARGQKQAAAKKGQKKERQTGPVVSQGNEDTNFIERGATKVENKLNEKIEAARASDNRAVRGMLSLRRTVQAYSRNNIESNTREKQVRDAEDRAWRSAKSSGDRDLAKSIRRTRRARESRNALIYGLGAYTGHNEYHMVRGKKVRLMGADVTMRRVKASKRKMDLLTRTYVNTIGKHVNPTSIVHRRFEILRSTLAYGMGMRRRYGTKVGWSAMRKRYNTRVRKDNRRLRRRFIRRVTRKAQDIAFTPLGRAAIRVGIRSAIMYRNYSKRLRKRGLGRIASRRAAARYIGRYNISKARESAALAARGGKRSSTTRYAIGNLGVYMARKTVVGRFVFGSGKRRRATRGGTTAQRSRAFRATSRRRTSRSKARRAGFLRAGAVTSKQRSLMRRGRSNYSKYYTARRQRAVTGGKRPRGRRSSWTRPHKR